MSHQIRTFGDPVLRSPARLVDEITPDIRRLAADMIETMRAYKGVGVAAPQVGVGLAMFVYDDGLGAGPQTVVNPQIIETSGEWTYEEGCLSVPGQFFPITRPGRVVMQGTGLDNEALEIEARDLTARIFLHEVDHLRGKLLLSALEPEQRKAAMRHLHNSGAVS